ncbi:MAG: alpha-amylase family glycosyl hydrolase [Sandaracinaceae bacterium]|nr:alpha-amylase family glycosyl hydrolase [Sandaracinaceae bacterium]
MSRPLGLLAALAVLAAASVALAQTDAPPGEPPPGEPEPSEPAGDGAGEDVPWYRRGASPPPEPAPEPTPPQPAPEPAAEPAQDEPAEPAEEAHRGDFYFGSYGRVVVASDLEGRTGRQSNITAWGPRVDEIDTYAEIELRREDHFAGIDTQIVATIAYGGPIFHFDGEFSERIAIRNLFAETRNILTRGLAVWAGSRMWRGDDIYLFNFWPLDNLNMIGGGLRYALEEIGELSIAGGLAQPNDPFQRQEILVPARAGFIPDTVVFLDRPRLVLAAKLTWWPLGRSARDGAKGILYYEQHILPAGERRSEEGFVEPLPEDLGWAIGAQVGGYLTDQRTFAEPLLPLRARPRRLRSARRPLHDRLGDPDRARRGGARRAERELGARLLRPAGRRLLALLPRRGPERLLARRAHGGGHRSAPARLARSLRGRRPRRELLGDPEHRAERDDGQPRGRQRLQDRRRALPLALRARHLYEAAHPRDLLADRARRRRAGPLPRARPAQRGQRRALPRDRSRMVVQQQQLRLLSALALAAIAGCAHDQLAGVKDAEIATHVEDWRDQVIYQLMVDRFANGDARNDWRVDPTALARYQGGDWQGVIDRMDYLQELGVTALWISPVVLNVDTDAGFDGYHGYWAVDLTRVNPHFGDLATLRAMVDEAHARGMLVILDIVTNHLGQVFYYDINQNGQPDDSVYGSGVRPPGGSPSGVESPLSRVTEFDPDFDPRGIQSFTSLGEAGPAPIRFFDMPEIFRVPPSPPLFADPTAYSRRGRTVDYEVPEQLLWGDFPGGLKDVNTLDERVREEMVRVYVDWVLETDLDGFRIDTIKHVDYGFWEFFAPEVRRRLAAEGKNNFFLFGEAFDGRDDLIGSFTLPGRLDSVFYFSQKFRVFDEVFARGGATSRDPAPLRRARHQLRARAAAGRHRGRAGSRARELPRQPRRAALPLRAERRARPRRAARGAHVPHDRGRHPCIYYGTEQELAGGNDPSNREPLWRTGYDTSNATFQHIARLARVRARYEALRRGGFELRWVTDRTGDAEDAGIVAFERRTEGGDYALVVINAQGEHESVTGFEADSMTVSAGAGAVLIDALSGARFTVASDETLRLTVPPHGALVLVPEADYAPL